jgi:DNA-binding LacI/PurR family transcriptional regulator
MFDVARSAGVSQKTVSRVVNGEPHVSQAVRERVLREIERLGYRRNESARALVTRRSRRIGIVTTGTSYFGPAAVLHGLERAARGAGYFVSVVHADEEDEEEARRSVAHLVSQGVDAIAVSAPSGTIHPAEHVPPGIPVVTIDYPGDEGEVGEEASRDEEPPDGPGPPAVPGQSVASGRHGDPGGAANPGGSGGPDLPDARSGHARPSGPTDSGATDGPGPPGAFSGQRLSVGSGRSKTSLGPGEPRTTTGPASGGRPEPGHAETATSLGEPGADSAGGGRGGARDAAGAEPTTAGGVPSGPEAPRAPAAPAVPRIVVGNDDFAGARLATEHLLGLGHRTVHHLGGPPGWAVTAHRERGWRTALRAAGVPAPAPPRHGDWSAASGYRAAQELLATPAETPLTPLTALFVANDQMAIGAIHAIERSGRRVPHDISVVGFDDIPEAAYLSVPLTTIRQDFDAIAEQAMRRLIAAITGAPPPAGSPRVPVHLAVRASTAPPPEGAR